MPAFLKVSPGCPNSPGHPMSPSHLHPDLVAQSLLIGALWPLRRRAATAHDFAAVAATMREIGRSEHARASTVRAACELTGAALGGLLEPDGRGNLVLSGAHGLE